MAKSKTAGRPAGSSNSPHVVVTVVPAACPHCQSTDRESVRVLREWDCPGITPTGQPHTHIVWRRVHCLGCGQYFVEQEYQNRVTSEKKQSGIPILDR